MTLKPNLPGGQGPCAVATQYRQPLPKDCQTEGKLDAIGCDNCHCVAARIHTAARTLARICWQPVPLVHMLLSQRSGYFYKTIVSGLYSERAVVVGTRLAVTKRNTEVHIGITHTKDGNEKVHKRLVLTPAVWINKSKLPILVVK